MERRKLTAEQARRQADGGTRVAPGIWLDAEGCIHVNVPELMQIFDVEDTPENRRAVEAVAISSLEGMGSVIVQEVDEP